MEDLEQRKLAGQSNGSIPLAKGVITGTRFLTARLCLRPHACYLQAEIARLRDELALARSSASQAPAHSRQLTAAQMAATPLRELEGDQAFPTPRTGNRYTSSVSPSAIDNLSVNILSWYDLI